MLFRSGFLPQTIRFGGLTGSVVASDGRALPRSINATSLDTVSAERYDILFKPTTRGTYTVEVDVKNWVTGSVIGTAKTRIVVR